MSTLGNEALRDHWRQLGFYAFADSDQKAWRVQGSRTGLFRFASLLKQYAADARNAPISEHAHYGPLGSLEVMTWDRARLDDHAIAGTLDDLRRLAGLVESRLGGLMPGGVGRIHAEYSPDSPFALQLEVKSDDFDPGAADPWLPVD